RTPPHPDISDQQLFWGADQYDFSVVLRAEALECFWHFAHQGETFYLNFMRAPPVPPSMIPEVRFQLPGPRKQVFSFYQMCCSNFHNHFGSMQVFLSFGVYYEGSQDSAHLKEEDQKKKEEASRALNSTLSIIQSSTHRVEVHVFHMFRHYSFGRMRKSADHFLLLSNSQYISWWSTALSLLIVTSGYLQLLFLKRLFVTRLSGEDGRPRC
ncbi:unnamed protein product, partial [Tetraodon nigroviridis]